MQPDVKEDVIPPALLHAVSQADGKIVLVIGAGCSFADDTRVPMARECSQTAYASLIIDNVLEDGDCSDPDDLSMLADSVFDKTQKQSELVKKLPLDAFRRAHHNLGYLTLAALLRENVVSSVLTLNFDLALDHALSEVSAVDVASISCPEQIGELKLHNVVYLHRNVQENDYEKWILRASALEKAWVGGWEEMLARYLLTSPVVVFAGLGSPASVLLETTKLIRAKLQQLSTYQADPIEAAKNSFFAALNISPECYIKLGWNEFMGALGKRACQQQLAMIGNACREHVSKEGFAETDVSGLFDSLATLDIIGLGRMRSRWLLADEHYTPHSPHVTDLLIDLLAAANTIRSRAKAVKLFFTDGTVEFRDDEHRVITTAIMASGKANKSWATMEQDIAEVRARLSPILQPKFAVVSGATGTRLADLVTPPNVALEGIPEDDIVPSKPIFHLIDSYELNKAPMLVDDFV